jgi:hypothetical protein
MSKEIAAHIAADWEFLLIFDAIVFLLTFVKGYRGIKGGGIGETIETPLMTVMVRDGTWPS